jgi:hypothetical protein
VLFIWFIYRSILCKLVLYIQFLKENSAYSKSVWFSYSAPAAVLRKDIFCENSGSQSCNIWFVLSVPWSPFVRVFFYFRLMFYYDYVNEWKMDKIHIYRFIVYHLFEIKTVHRTSWDGQSYMVGWTAKIILSDFIHFYSLSNRKFWTIWYDEIVDNFI